MQPYMGAVRHRRVPGFALYVQHQPGQPFPAGGVAVHLIHFPTGVLPPALVPQAKGAGGGEVRISVGDTAGEATVHPLRAGDKGLFHQHRGGHQDVGQRGEDRGEEEDGEEYEAIEEHSPLGGISLSSLPVSAVPVQIQTDTAAQQHPQGAAKTNVPPGIQEKTQGDGHSPETAEKAQPGRRPGACTAGRRQGIAGGPSPLSEPQQEPAGPEQPGRQDGGEGEEKKKTGVGEEKVHGDPPPGGAGDQQHQGGQDQKQGQQDAPAFEKGPQDLPPEAAGLLLSVGLDGRGAGGRFVKVEGPYLLDQGPPGIGAQGQIVGPLTVAGAAPIYTPHLRRPCGDKVGKGAQPYPVQGPALRCPAVQKGLRGLDVHDGIGEQGPASLSHGRPPLAAPGLRRPPAGGAAQTPPPESFAPPG